MDFKTEQEIFWAGKFGSNYIKRNQSDRLLASNIKFFSRALNSAQDFESVIEFGANIGMNLRALRSLYPTQVQAAIEINVDAANFLRSECQDVTVFNESILDYTNDKQFDLVFTKGVLIHIAPDMLPLVYKKLYEASRKYILICEYFNPSPISIDYRGHEDKLFKRDFAAELSTLYGDLALLDYGFVYKWDRHFSQDNITWFLFQKSK